MILAQRAETLSSLTSLAASLPPNLAGVIPPEDLRKIFKQMFDDFVWPQIQARLPFEHKWNDLQKMYEVKRNTDSIRQSPLAENKTLDIGKEKTTELSDTIIFDTVDRLKNLNYFICWKDSPVQYNRPKHTFTPLEDQFYTPTSRKLNAANAILDWNSDMQEVRGKHLALAQHHYLYGVSFVFSDFVMDIDMDESSPDYLLIKDIGTTFQPISIRKLWLNPLIPMDQMDKQPCPFFFDLFPRSQILANEYNAQTNPFGFANLDKLNSPQWLFGQESSSFSDGLNSKAKSTMTILRPEFSGEALWTFYPYLTLPGMKTKRYIVQCFANDLFSGQITPLRLQELYYPHKRLPIYGSSHIPDLDSGLYTPSVAELLEAHFDELVRCKTQFLLNKDWINDPPTEIMSGTPAANYTGINKPGAKYEVHGVNDVTRRVPYDATATNLQYYDQTRSAAQTTGKAVDAILGKAMGGRTTATEASNAFQASMSGVTADVDNFSNQIYGSYAERAWDNAGKFIPKNIRDIICGNSNAAPLTDQEMLIHVGVKTDVGSTFIESIAKQQHLQYAIQAAISSPVLDQAILWKALFRELKLTSALDAVKDNGMEFQIGFATDQAVATYAGQAIAIDPSQDHQVAINVKTRYLQDTKSVYNTEMAANPSPIAGLTVTQYLAQQISVHQQFLMLQMQQQMMMQQAVLKDENDQAIAAQESKNQGNRAGKPTNPDPTNKAGHEK